MWWIAFTAVDLYIGLIVLDTLVTSLLAEKRGRATVAKEPGHGCGKQLDQSMIAGVVQAFPGE